MATAISPSTWVSTQDLCRELKLSRSTLQKLKNRGTFVPGVHYYKRGTGRTSPAAWSIEACRAALLRLTATDPQSIETYLGLPTGRDA
jgi:hypothetical protein